MSANARLLDSVPLKINLNRSRHRVNLKSVKTILAILLLVVGCSTKQEQKPWNEPAAWRPEATINAAT